MAVRSVLALKQLLPSPQGEEQEDGENPAAGKPWEVLGTIA